MKDDEDDEDDTMTLEEFRAKGRESNWIPRLGITATKIEIYANMACFVMLGISLIGLGVVILEIIL